jgi:hypothetical protein
MNPKYPIYIVSKGRHDSRLTAKSLEEMGCPYFIVVEPHEYDLYCSVIDANKVLTLPLSNHGNGPGLARNWCWEHSICIGAKWHWVMDDNIYRFARINNNLKINVADGTIFKCMEDFCERYSNVYIAGPNYAWFAKRKQLIPPFILNTRIYSCLLIRNDIPYRWRGRYNEDTDLCLRVLKDGFCTVQFNAFIQWKAMTQTIQGGCTAEFYAKEGTSNKSKMLEMMHPDVAKVVWKFGRWHHHVNYGPFQKNKLILKEGVEIKSGADNYGMKIVKV